MQPSWEKSALGQWAVVLLGNGLLGRAAEFGKVLGGSATRRWRGWKLGFGASPCKSSQLLRWGHSRSVDTGLPVVPGESPGTEGSVAQAGRGGGTHTVFHRSRWLHPRGWKHVAAWRGTGKGFWDAFPGCAGVIWVIPLDADFLHHAYGWSQAQGKPSSSLPPAWEGPPTNTDHAVPCHAPPQGTHGIHQPQPGGTAAHLWHLSLQATARKRKGETGRQSFCSAQTSRALGCAMKMMG